MDDGQRLPLDHRITDFFLQDDPDGQVDRGIFPIATRAQRLARQGDLEGIGAGDIAGRVRRDRPLYRSRWKTLGIECIIRATRSVSSHWS